MAAPFVRIDLSNDALDFQNTVLEQGWPLLDKANGNYQILRRWLGTAVAEPERKGDRVEWFIASEEGGRIAQPVCVPLSEKELDGPFKKLLEGLAEKLEAVEPQTAAERTLHRRAAEELRSLLAPSRAADRRCYLFKYRDAKNRWRLVWCPGFRRRDAEPASPVVCTNPNCSHLFLRRSSGSGKCPHCQRTPGRGALAGGASKRGWLLPALLLIALLAGLGGGWWIFQQQGLLSPAPTTDQGPALVVTPETAAIPVGGRIEFTVTLSEDGRERDVSGQAVAVAEDPKVAGFGLFGTTATAKTPGSTLLHFHMGNLSTTCTLVVEPPTNPDRVAIVPDKVVLGVGTTARLKMIGTYSDGREVELTDAAEWSSQIEDRCFSYRGLLEGLEPGRCRIRARYRATPDSDSVEALAEVEVVEQKHKSLELAVGSETVTVGGRADLEAYVVAEDGQKLPVLESSLLKLDVEPPEAAAVDGRHVYGRNPGRAVLSAAFRGLTATAEFEVAGEDGASAEPRPLAVTPRQLNLVVGEIAGVEVQGVQREAIRLNSGRPDVVEVSADNRVIGRSPGSAAVEVVEGGRRASVEVTVSAADFRSLSIEPESLSVRVDDVAPLRVWAEVEQDKRVELAPGLVEWVRFPRPEYARLDREALEIKGLKATGDDAEPLAARFRNHEATGQVRVISGPLRLELKPAGPIELPVGQKQTLEVWASYGDGRRVQVPPERVQWRYETLDGLLVDTGAVHAQQPNADPLKIAAVYQGQTSNEVEVASVHAVALTLAAQAVPSTLNVGETGQLVLSAASPSGRTVELSTIGMTFESSDEAKLVVDEQTGAFEAVGEGTAEVMARHPEAAAPATVDVTVAAPPSERLKPPVSLVLRSDQPSPVEIAVGVEFDDFRVEAVDENGTARDVTSEALLKVDDDPTSAAVAVRNGRWVGVRPGQSAVAAEYAGVSAEGELAIRVSEELDIDEIRIEPGSTVLAVNESTSLEAAGYRDGRRVGLITAWPGLEWKSQNPAVARIDGGTVLGVAAGTTEITAQAVGVVSSPGMTVDVVESAEAVANELAAVPARLTLRAGESVRLGRDVFVRRGTADFSREALVSPAADDIVAYHPESRTLQGLAPGRTRVAFTVGRQAALMDVDVLSAAEIDDTSRVVLEPAGGLLSIGELLDLNVWLISADGRRVGMTASAALTSDDENIAAVFGRSIQGVSRGRVQITARLPGVEAAATAEFEVAPLEIERLIVSPPRLDVSVGQRVAFEISGVGPAGRRVLGDHPDLSIGVEGSSPESIDLNAAARQVLGLAAGQAALRVRFRGVETAVPVEVLADPVTGLVVRPASVSVPAGESFDFQVFAQREHRLQPLTPLDGVELHVADPVIAEAADGFRIRGLRPGATQVTAQYGMFQAAAPLTVESAPRRSTRSPSPVALRFIPDIMRLEIGTPGGTVRVVRVHSDGRREDVGHQVRLSVREPQAVALEDTGSGPIVRPLRIGQTQVDAQLGPLRTRTPLLVDVMETAPARARLSVSPNPLRIETGETGAFRRVVVIPGAGRSPVELPYKVTATPNSVMSVQPDGTVRGQTVGTAVAQVTVDAPDSKYDGLDATVTVEVGGGVESLTQAGDGTARLVLEGPSETTVGSEVRFRVNLISGGSGRDVTHDSTTLVVDGGEEVRADVLPGCRLSAKRPGTVVVRARHRNLISHAHELQILPLAGDWQRIELAIPSERLGVGESREYRVWGYSAAGRRQDLTGLVGDSDDSAQPHVRFTVIEPNPGTHVAVHRPPAVIGRQAGRVRLQAALGERLVSEPVEIEVVGEIEAPIRLRIEPPRLTARVGEPIPPLRLLVRSPGDRTFRLIDAELAELESLDTEVLVPAPETPGKFRGLRPGATRIKASFRNLEAFAEVQVGADRFKSVRHGELNVGTTTFSVPLQVAADAAAGELEYRFIRPDEPAEGGWKRATLVGDQLQADLDSPQLEFERSNFYKLVIESRDVKDGTIERYPFAFRLGDRRLIRE